MPRPRSWTDEQLIAAVAASRTLKEVHERLGLKPGKYDVMRAHIKRLGIDAAHLPRASEGSPRSARKFSDDDLVTAVQEATTVHGVLRLLGYPLNGGMFRYIKAHIKRLDLDTSHFTGQAWSKGLKLPRGPQLAIEEVLVENGPGGELCRHLWPYTSPTDRRGLQGGEVRGVRPDGVARETPAPVPRPHQRGPHRQPPGEPPYPVSELPRPNRHLVRAQSPA